MKRLIQYFLMAAILTAPIYAAAQEEQEIMARFAHEPTIEETQAAAVEYIGLSAERLEGLYSRAGGSNALPKSLYYELQYRDKDTDRPQKEYNYNDPASNDWATFKQKEYHQDEVYLQHKMRAQWDLSRVVYNPDQLRVVSQMNSATKTRDSLLKAVTKTYFARRKLQIDLMLNPPSDITEKLEMDLRLQEMTAQLDAQTGGWFSKNIKK
ncbi:MAG: hypothetical protein J6S69_09040 [Proteobacteria bacterium]|jgi:hypothetical protein|nr:hypothetical protein [Pseudomonadota bacterium]